jgi:hypothetical protein
MPISQSEQAVNVNTVAAGIAATVYELPTPPLEISVVHSSFTPSQVNLTLIGPTVSMSVQAG